MENYTVIILTTPADFERLLGNNGSDTSGIYKRMVRNLAPRRVIFVGRREVGELIDRSDIKNDVGFLNEEELIPFADVHKLMMELLNVQELSRGVTGWYYQQFLKMQYAFACKDEYYLVWDGDTVPCKPFSMFQNEGYPCLDLKQEYHEEYFHTIQNLFPEMQKCISKSFVSEHMLIKCDIMRQLIQDIMAQPQLTGSVFYERILRAIRPGQLMNTAFSEFETYGTYVSFRHMGVYRLRNWYSFRLGGEFFHPERMTDEDYAWLGRDFDAISFEKGHEVRADHEEIFTSPRYREKLSARQILELAQKEFKEGYMEVWDEAENDPITELIKEAGRCEAAGDRDGMFQAIKQGLKQDCDNYELYYMLGFYYLNDNIDQAYLCFQNALYHCDNEEDRAVIQADMDNLLAAGGVSVRRTAIIIVSYNSCYLMQKNIESIRKTVMPETCQIVVVDNASDDGVTEWLADQEDVLLIRNEKNMGFSPACNRGAESLKGSDYDIFLLNNDTRLAPNALFWLRMGLYENEKIGAAGSCANYAGNEQQIEVEFTLPDEYLDYGAFVNVPMEEPYEERVRLSGFSMLIKGPVWNMTGGMDESFAPGYFEDDDLSMKILKAGYRLLYCKNSFIYHAGSQCFAKRPDVEQLLLDHHQLFIRKYGFDILEYARADRNLIENIPYLEKEEFNLLFAGSGLGAELKEIRTKFPKANVIGLEKEAALYEISRKTDTVFPSVEKLRETFSRPVFHVLMIPKNKYASFDHDEMRMLGEVCLPNCTVLPKPDYGKNAAAGKDDKVSENAVGRNNVVDGDNMAGGIDVQKIKLVVWDMDNTFWKGILSEGGVTLSEENIKLVKDFSDCGIVNSISSKNDKEEVMKVLKEQGLDGYFVFPDINWQNKGEQIKKKLEDMHLRAENTLFLDDDIRNLEEAKYYNPEIMTGQPDLIPELIRRVKELEKRDPEHKRLKSYQMMEKRQDAQQEFSSREQFLYHSGITMEICGDCGRVLDRIAELVARTNQLNYTKVRDSKDILMDLIADENIRKGYVKVKDRFGDYGIVGFYCFEPDNGILRHFLFSCRTMGMGIEQCLYRLLGMPELTIEEPVASKLDTQNESPAPWIKVIDMHRSAEQDGGEPDLSEQTEDREPQKDNRIKVLLKGPCDLDSIAPYLSGGNLTTEFNFVNDRGFITTGQNHSMHIWESAVFTKQQLQEIVQEVPFITMEDFQTSLFEKEYHVICYSLLSDCHAGLYRNRRTGAYLSFGSRNFDLTAPEFKQGYIDGTIVNHAFPFTEKIIDDFAKNWEFVGSTSVEDILRNLDYIYTHVPGEPMFVLLLGSEIEYEGVNEEFADHVEIHKKVNALVKEYAADKDRIRLIEITDFIKSQDDYADSINHFSRNVYYDLATSLCLYINEKVDKLLGV